MADGGHVFISYCSANRAEAAALKARLEAERHPVWIDQKGLVAGEPYHEDIAKAITDAYAAVVIWSPDAVASLWVYAEAQRAKGQRKIVPVRIEPATGDKLVIPLPFDALHTIRYERTADIIAAVERRRQRMPLEPAENRSTDAFARDIIDPKFSPLPADAVDTSPTTLLHARHALVPFDDETGALAELIGWATGKPAWARGRLALARMVHGPGGLGKTRLLVEASQRLFDLGWIAGFVPHEVFREADRFEELRRILRRRIDCNGVLIAIDYVEALRKEDIARLSEAVLEAAGTGGPPIRVVVLARSAGEWWTSLVNADTSLQRLTARDGGPDTIALPPMGRGRSDRVALFDAAWQEFDAQIRAFETRHDCKLRKDAAVDFDAIERMLQAPGDTTFDRPLFIHIAALLAAYGEAETSIARGVPGLLDNILGLEHDHWDRSLRLEPNTNKREAIHRAAAQVTAVGKVPDAESVRALVAADPFYAAVSDTDAVQTSRAVCRLLPGTGAEIEGLQPDLVGEHHLLDRMTVELLETCLAWAGGNEGRRIALLTVLQRATRGEHGDKAKRAEALLEHLVRRHGASLAKPLMQVMESTLGRAMQRVEALLGDLPFDVAAALSFALPRYNTKWLEFAARVTGRHVAAARDAAAAIGALDAEAPDNGQIGAVSQYSTALNNHSARLSDDGRREAALAVTEEAVSLYRALAAARPDAFTPDLARAISMLSDIHSAMGHHGEAAAAAHEALRVLLPHLERLPQAHARLARAIGGDIIKFSEAAGIEPDMELLQRALAAIQSAATGSESGA